MTAIVGVLNKHAVAIAADSAVTLGGGKKVMNVANKLFALSKHQPVAIAIYGNAEFIGTPWETIIKEYRKKLGDKSFPHLKGYVDNFIKFLRDKNYYCTDQEADEDTASSIYFLLKNICDVSFRDTDRFNRVLNNLEKQNLPNLLGGFTRDTVDHLNKIVDVILPDVLNYLNNEGVTIEEVRLKSFIESVFTHNICHTRQSGLVFSGYGEKDLFPATYNCAVGGVINKRLSKIIKKEAEISKKKGSAIRPFAQTDVMKTILEGVAPMIQDIYLSSMEKTFLKFTEILAKALEPKDKALSEAIKDLKIDAFKIMFLKMSKTAQKKNYSDPFEDSVASLEKEDLADFAESLIRLTSLKRRISFDQDTVGGPIDVMVISKGDGVIWMKRKHYFDPSLNHQFFNNYFNL